MGDTGHPAKADGLSQAEPEVSALRASIPDAGQVYHSEGYQMWVDHVADVSGDPVVELWRFRCEDDPYDGDGYLWLRVHEVIKTQNSGTLAVYHRQWIAPDGQPAWGSRKKRVIGSLGSLKALIKRRNMTAKAMETGTAKTEGLGAKHDSSVAKPFAHKEQ